MHAKHIPMQPYMFGDDMTEKYKIEVSDECVEITGTLTIREAFDFLNFFEREGYTTLEDWGEKTTLYLRKRDLDKELTDRVNEETLSDLNVTKIRLEESDKSNKDFKQRINDLEYLIKKITLDDKEKSDKLKDANHKLQQFKALENLKNSSQAAQICKMEGPGQEMEDLTGFSEGTIE